MINYMVMDVFLFITFHTYSYDSLFIFTHKARWKSLAMHKSSTHQSWGRRLEFGVLDGEKLFGINASEKMASEASANF